MKGEDLIKQLVKAGWEVDRITGSHHILRKGDELISVGNIPFKCGYVTQAQ
ncbi:YcfA-like protein [Candidatus Magnetobacterium bavaricum]|uniref:YcfA-like protein n=1 Tax=Candidatus Magnetobacterium bavaricum TaxID=29290 RepID=A0A0F3GXP3_9BACT|nr:YcfA-like protein [Candidatus Magnetobacterium bavaricum]